MLVLSLIFPILFSLASQALECGPNEYQVKAHPRSAYVKSDGTQVAATDVKGHCRPKSRAYIFWNDKIRNGRPSDWPNSSEKSVDWTEEEKERLLEALEKIPDDLWMEKFRGFYRMKKSKDFPNPASFADQMSAIYDSAFDSKANLARILAHELAHSHYASMSRDQRLEYKKAAGWDVAVNVDEGSYKEIRRKSGYVQKDGELSAEEDFANNLEFYIFDQKQLKTKTPEVYAFEDVKNFIVGTTTAADVEKKFGPPGKILQEGKVEVWVYIHPKHGFPKFKAYIKSGDKIMSGMVWTPDSEDREGQLDVVRKKFDGKVFSQGKDLDAAAHGGVASTVSLTDANSGVSILYMRGTDEVEAVVWAGVKNRAPSQAK